MPLSAYDRAKLPDILAGHGDWFTAQLLRLIVKADSVNQTKLSQGFPEEVALVQQYWRGELKEQP